MKPSPVKHHEHGWSGTVWVAGGPDDRPAMTGPERMTLEALQEVAPVQCRTCGIVWWMSRHVIDSRLTGNGSLYCPNGHERARSKGTELDHVDLVRRQMDSVIARNAQLEREIEEARQRASDLEGIRKAAEDVVQGFREERAARAALLTAKIPATNTRTSIRHAKKR